MRDAFFDILKINNLAPCRSPGFFVLSEVDDNLSWKALKRKPESLENRHFFLYLWTAFNRTILELKPKEGKSVFYWEQLLIVPFWNWNKPYQNWKIYGRCLLIVPFWNWNLAYVPYTGANQNLLIVPFWNWNEAVKDIGKFLKAAFNRTILELKHFLKAYRETRRTAF